LAVRLDGIVRLPVAGLLMAVASTAQVLAGYSATLSLSPEQIAWLIAAGAAAGLGGWWTFDHNKKNHR
jgi:hypothetical protein